MNKTKLGNQFARVCVETNKATWEKTKTKKRETQSQKR